MHKKESVHRDLAASNGQFDVGELIACDSDLSEYLNFNIGSDNFVLTFPADSLTFSRDNAATTIYASNPPDGISFDVYLNDTVPYTFTQESRVRANGIFYSSKAIAPDNLYTVTRYGKANEFK